MGDSIVILISSMIFLPRCYKVVYANSFFPHTARIRHYFLAQCFVGTYDDLNGLKSKVNRHLVALGRL